MNKNTYSTNKKNSLRDKAVLNTRTQMYNIMGQKLPLNYLKSVIDVGVTADNDMESSNFFEKLYPYKDRITALSNQDASWMEHTYKGLRFIRASALNMPVCENSFDLVFSSAVIEHVGSRNNQKRFIEECVRISKQYVFITTPNKWHPIEFHTALPFLHWYPPPVHRKILTCIGKDFFASEDNLNLLSKKDLIHMMDEIDHIRYSIYFATFLGLRSNILLLIEKL